MPNEGGEGLLYQPIGVYHPARHPQELTCELALNQTLDGNGSAPVSVSRYDANGFEPLDGRDVHDASGVTQLDQPQIHPSWADGSTTTGKHSPNRISARFE